jgi:hypothetical protein
MLDGSLTAGNKLSNAINAHLVLPGVSTAELGIAFARLTPRPPTDRCIAGRIFPDASVTI